MPSAKIQVALWLCLTEDLGKPCEQAGKFTNIPLSVSAFMIASASYRSGRLSILDHSMRQTALGLPCAVSNQICPLVWDPTGAGASEFLDLAYCNLTMYLSFLSDSFLFSLPWSDNF